MNLNLLLALTTTNADDLTLALMVDARDPFQAHRGLSRKPPEHRASLADKLANVGFVIVPDDCMSTAEADMWTTVGQRRHNRASLRQAGVRTDYDAL